MFGIRQFTLRMLALVVIALPLFIAASPAAAATIHIDYSCTLHAALNAANKDKAKSGCESGKGDDVIVINRNIQPSSGKLPQVDKDLTIDGANHTITVGSSDPFLTVQGAHLTLKDATIVFAGVRSGKAMEIKDGKLTLVNVRFKQCKKGIKQTRSHTSISGDSDICGLSSDDWVYGSGTTDINPPAPPPAPETCGPLSAAGITVLPTYGLGSGAQCQRMSQGEIGDQSALSGGFIDAVNLWAYVQQGVEICFNQLGALTFIDFSTSPRTISTLAPYNKNGHTCATVNAPGIVILVPGTPSSATPPPSAAAPASSQPTAPSAPTGCPIHTTGHLKLRAKPSLVAEILDWVPRGSNLAAISRTTFWYQISYAGQTGWIGGAFVRGNC